MSHNNDNIRIATWNINGIKARLHNLEKWLQQSAPDIVCLQEIKSVDAQFPRELFEQLGYNVATHGQKSFNGVAIFSKFPIEEIRSGLPGDDNDPQARYLEAVIATPNLPLRVASIYLPNGNPMGSEKYPYKLRWMERLYHHARQLMAFEEPTILAGDYNVIPQEEDCYDPAAWTQDALFQLEIRNHYRALQALGYTDAVATTHTEKSPYTFWDFQGGAWPKNHGIRIDHALLSPSAADRLTQCVIDKHVRGWEKPSDHVPLLVTLMP